MCVLGWYSRPPFSATTYSKSSSELEDVLQVVELAAGDQDESPPALPQSLEPIHRVVTDNARFSERAVIVCSEREVTH